ncbi:MAG: hypothetical protein HXY50_00450 [Ignavibacteriaceae bacterium]|nr:hypothetical protein [Ignavibacteriaceae bacterium]
MKNIILSISLLFSTLLILSCGEAEDIITPTHYSRVPRPTNLSISFDTTSTGKYRVQINWQVNSTENLKDFEIYRSVNNGGFFFLFGGITSTSYVDSTNSKATDSLKLAYFVNGRGIDRFVGQSSDTIRIIATNKF